MDDRLKKEIETHKIGAVLLPKNPSEAPRALQPIKGMENQPELPFEQKASKFVRSQRSIAMRIKEDYESQATVMEQEKIDLIRRLNDAIRELDQLNQEKGELNDKLISLFKFTRDVERQTLRSDDLMTVVDESLKEELKCEKQ